MVYREYGKTKLRLSALGFGMNRFTDKHTMSGAGVDSLAELIVSAVRLGINHIDIADEYSGGYAPEIVKAVMKEIDKDTCHVSVKVSGYSASYTAESALKRIESSLVKMGLDKATFGYLWAIRSLEEYRVMMQKDGVMEGLIKAKKEGMIKHICLSVHASLEDTFAMLDNDIIEGITISCNPINYLSMIPIIEKAKSKKIGIMTMNTLAGGIIPQNEKTFEYLKLLSDESVVTAALRFIASIDGITSVLSGMTSYRELKENLSSVDELENEQHILRKNNILKRQDDITGFCTGCNYCDDCPAELPIATLMTGYNFLLFDSHEDLKRFNMMEYYSRDSLPIWFDKGNPCLSCGKCEKNCTQKLPIISRLNELNKDFIGYSLRSQDKEHMLYELLIKPSYKKIVFYPGSIFTKRLLLLLKRTFKEIPFNVIVCDRDTGKYGKVLLDKIFVQSPEIIKKDKPDAIVITSYSYANEIYEHLKEFQKEGIEIINLKEFGKIPWWYW